MLKRKKSCGRKDWFLRSVRDLEEMCMLCVASCDARDDYACVCCVVMFRMLLLQKIVLSER